MTIYNSSKKREPQPFTPLVRRAKLLDKSKRVTECIDWIKSEKTKGKKITFEEAGRLFELPKSTLYDAYRGRNVRLFAHESQQALTSEQEIVLVEWIQFWGARGVPMTKQGITSKANAIIGREIGKKWAYNFFLRHHDKIESKRARTLDPKCARQVNPTIVKDFQRKLSDLVTGKNIPSRNIYNMDEKGIVCGGREQTKVFVSRGQRHAVKIGQNERDTTTIIECVCADGSYISPMVIFKGVRHSSRWYVEEDHGLNAT